jgi:hypothetical protein
MTFKVIVAGSREFADYGLLKARCDAMLCNKSDIEIVSGGARGPDSLGEKYAKENGLKLKLFPADWNKLGKAAGHYRNAEMANYADALICFWDGTSRGSLDMINKAKVNGLLVRIVRVPRKSQAR